MIRGFAVLLALVVLAACATVPAKDYTKFNAAKPSSILVVPTVNRSVDITASDYMLSTLSIPVAERGYYVFPVNLVKRVLEDDGLSDANLVHSASAEKLASLFGADAVLYVTINRWDAQYFVLSTQVTVDVSYVVKDGKTGDMLWEHRQKMVYVPQNSGGHPIAMLITAAVNAAITKMAPNYMPLARQANAQTFAYPGPGIPPGVYAKEEGAAK